MGYNNYNNNKGGAPKKSFNKNAPRNDANDKPKKLPIGALWKRQGPYGTFMSGVIEVNGEKISINVNSNKKYKEEKGTELTPDFQIFLGNPNPNAPKPTSKPAYRPKAAPRQQEEEEGSELDNVEPPEEAVDDLDIE